MMTRWEVVGELRTLYPTQRRAHGRRRVDAGRGAQRARGAQRVLGALCGVVLATALIVARAQTTSHPSIATLQDATWGDTYVTSWRARSAPVYGHASRHGSRSRRSWSVFGGGRYARR